MALSYLSSASLTGFQDATPTFRIFIVDATVPQDFLVIDKTGSGDTTKKFTASKRISYPIQGRGWYQTTADSGATYADVHITANMASLSGEIFGIINRCIVVKQYQIVDITANTDAVPQKVWDNGGLATYFGVCEGLIEASGDTFYETDHNTTPATLVIPLGNGTLSGSAIVSAVTPQAALYTGGAYNVQYRWQYTSTVTVTTNPFSLATWTLTYNHANGDSGTATCVLQRLEAHVDFRAGGLVPFFFSGQLSGAVA